MLEKGFRAGGFQKQAVPAPRGHAFSTYMLLRMSSHPRPDPLATRQRRIAEFDHEGSPPTDVDMEVLCQDRSGTYVLPFPCRYMEGRWINVRTGETIDAEVVGWRSRRS